MERFKGMLNLRSACSLWPQDLSLPWTKLAELQALITEMPGQDRNWGAGQARHELRNCLRKVRVVELPWAQKAQLPGQTLPAIVIGVEKNRPRSKIYNSIFTA